MTNFMKMLRKSLSLSLSLSIFGFFEFQNWEFLNFAKKKCITSIDGIYSSNDTVIQIEKKSKLPFHRAHQKISPLVILKISFKSGFSPPTRHVVFGDLCVDVEDV